MIFLMLMKMIFLIMMVIDTKNYYIYIYKIYHESFFFFIRLSDGYCPFCSILGILTLGYNN